MKKIHIFFIAVFAIIICGIFVFKYKGGFIGEGGYFDTDEKPLSLCYPGLKMVDACSEDKACPIMWGSWKFCVACGNGACDSHEDQTNCPQDCTCKENKTENNNISPENDGFATDAWIDWFSLGEGDKKITSYPAGEISPEKTVFYGLAWHTYIGGNYAGRQPVYENPYFSSGYKEKLKNFYRENEVILVDPVLLIQNDFLRIKIGSAETNSQSASLDITFDFSPIEYRQVALVLENGLWKIDSIKNNGKDLFKN